MEIQFLHERVVEKDPKLLMDHIQRMASGEAPFFPTTLSLVYDKLVEKAFTELSLFDPGSGGNTERQSLAHPTPPPQTSTSTSSAVPSSTVGPASPSNSRAPASTSGAFPSTTIPKLTQLRCVRCGELTRLRDLYEGLRCPRCPARGTKGRPFMQCTSCNVMLTELRDACPKKKCRRRYM